MITINIIGAGRLGKTLGKLMVDCGVGTLAGVCNASWASSLQAIQFIGQGTPCSQIRALPPADLTLITTPDDKIARCCDELVKTNHWQPNGIIAHGSGALSSSILQSAKDKGGLIASVHPMRSFADPQRSVEEYPGTFCAIEGDKEATVLLHAWFRAMGSITYSINGAHKSAYHAAGVFATNYLVTLFEKANVCLNEAEIDSETAVPIILNMMRGTLNNIERTKSPAASLTGPIQRGDFETISKHLETVSDPKLYKAMALATLEIAQLPKAVEEKIKALLQKTTY